MQNDRKLRDLILAELDWDPSFDSSHVGVQATNGIVTLTGYVGSYAEKLAVERAVARVKGVCGIAEEIVVRPANLEKTTDDEIARRAVNVLAWSVGVPGDRIKVKVQSGLVELSGEVEWQYQKAAALESVRKLGGVLGVSDLIAVKARAAAPDIKRKIEDALKRNAETEAGSIQVQVADGKVILEGKVRALYERDVIERAAWAAAGVRQVEDRVVVTG
jgi:osmotically-inducible protein OsmY